MIRILPTISIFFLLFLMAAGAFIWWPEYQKFEDLRFQLKIKEEALGDKQEHISKLNDISRKLEEHKESVIKIDSAIPDNVSEPDLYNFIRDASFKNGLTLKNIGSTEVPAPRARAGREEEIKEVQDIVFNATVHGPYPAFKNFLSNIYQSSRLIGVDSIKFSSPEKETDFFEIDITFIAHYMPKPMVQEQTP